MTANMYVDLGLDPELMGNLDNTTFNPLDYASNQGQQTASWESELPEGVLSKAEYNKQAQELYNQYKETDDLTALADFLVKTRYQESADGPQRAFLETFGKNQMNKKGQLNLEKVSMADLGFMDRDTKSRLAAGLAPSMIGLDPRRAADLATGGTFSVDANGQRRFEWSNSVAKELGPVGMMAVNGLLMAYGVPALTSGISQVTGLGAFGAGALASGGVSYAMGARGGNLIASALMGGLGANAKDLAGQLEAAKAAGDTVKVAQLTKDFNNAAQMFQYGRAADSLRTGNYLGLVDAGLRSQGMGGLTGNIAKFIGDDKGKFLGVLDADPMAQAALKYAKTGNAQDALMSYVQAGGGFGGLGGVDWKTPEFLKEFERTYLRPAGDVLGSLGRALPNVNVGSVVNSMFGGAGPQVAQGGYSVPMQQQQVDLFTNPYDYQVQQAKLFS